MDSLSHKTLDTQHLKPLRQEFAKLDLDGDGTLSSHELSRTVVECLGVIAAIVSRSMTMMEMQGEDELPHKRGQHRNAGFVKGGSH